MKYDYIKCGDCLELLKEIPDKSVDLIVTDPPYLKTKKNGYHKGLYTGGGAFGVDKRNYHNQLNGQELLDGFDFKILDELVRVMKKINIYIFCSKELLRPLLNYFTAIKNVNIDLLAWHKTNPVPTCNNKYLSDTEYILFFRENGVKIYGSYATKKKYYVSPTNKEDKKLYQHPTIKPLEIIENLIINSSKEGDIVLDPFLGSGTTVVAAKNLNRHYIGFELEPKYYEIAKQRIEQAKNAIQEQSIFDFIGEEDANN